MESTLEYVRFHALCSYACFGMSLVLNTLVVILVSNSEKLISIRNVFYAHSLVDIIYASASSIAPMYWAHLPHILLFFPTGPLAHIQILAPVAFQLQASAYVIDICLVCSTFLHQHKLLNRANFNQILSPQFDLDFEKIYLIGSDIKELVTMPFNP
ncbi:hypothetical protein PMAYCL1PPCAC_15661 [Pristionchus mayeri]|uniref:G protein-coupled receptor n=1 Tax=Pristionchus mayeri TaxID=1317129 RepID=A0AAN5HYV8_9BILA|nr:hypothetical protein PMAYCL1PPCAC_15661 [Pristionchus mayeri]